MVVFAPLIFRRFLRLVPETFQMTLDLLPSRLIGLSKLIQNDCQKRFDDGQAAIKFCDTLFSIGHFGSVQFGISIRMAGCNGGGKVG